MHRTILIILTSILLITITSCKSKMEKLEGEIYSEDFIYDSKGLARAGELLDLYVSEAESDPTGEAAPGYLFKAAELAMNLDRTQESMDLYNQVIYKYPDYEKAPECLFLLAFIYENTLQNYGKAKELYEQFLVRHPDHEFADDARFSLQHLGKSPEELMREFEKKNQPSTDTLAT